MLTNFAADSLAVMLGGAGGAALRWWITVSATAISGGSAWLGTTIANLLGCAAIAIMVVMLHAGSIEDLERDQPPRSKIRPPSTAMSTRTQLAIRVGLIGALTTFSTFIAEAIDMFRAAHWPTLAIYLIANLGLGVFVYSIVWTVTHSLWTRPHVL